MSKGVETLTTKASMLVSGLKKNINEVRTLGIDETYIARLEEEMSILQSTDQAVEKASIHLTELRRANNDAMSRLYNDVLAAKKAVKGRFDKSEWLRLGIADKQ